MSIIDTFCWIAASAPDLLAADPIPNPAPKDPTNGAKGIGVLIAIAKWGVLITCGICAVVSGAYLAVGKFSSRPGSSELGLTALLCSLAGALVAATAIAVTNGVFDATS